MSYKCSICDDPQPHGQKLRRWVVKRANGQIASEIPVCPDCWAGLKSGYTVEQVRRLVAPDTDGVPAALAHLPTTVASSTAPQAQPVHVGKK